jgi:hypothetical protein
MTKEFDHPELARGEVLLTNVSKSLIKYIPFYTKRKGRQAYDGIGNKLNIKDWFPIFVKIDELKEKNLDLAFVRKNWRTVEAVYVGLKAS